MVSVVDSILGLIYRAVEVLEVAHHLPARMQRLSLRSRIRWILHLPHR